MSGLPCAVVVTAICLCLGVTPAASAQTTSTSTGLVVDGIDVVGGQLAVIGLVLNPIIGTAIADGTARTLLEIRDLDDPTVQNDPMVEVATYTGLDLDMDPADDFSGTEPFMIDAMSVNPDGTPVVVFTPGSITAGDLVAGPATLDLLGAVGISLTGVLLEGTIAPNGASFTSDPIQGGAVPAVLLDQIDNPGLIPGSLLDLLIFFGTNPDVDLDGDGTNDAFSVDIAITAVSCVILPPILGTPFERGDCDADGTTNITDAVKSLQYLFLSDTILCESACDADDDGFVNITDPVALLQYLFAAGVAPPAPIGACDVDPTADMLTCDMYPSC
ncbi:MAG: hypothetical protein AAF581_02720 [Planctomycetota bacterium]